jgi:nitrogen regulatory protein PII
MKMVLAIVDARRAEAVRRDLMELGAPGYTDLAVAEGAGRTGVHRGDRVHPGAVELLFAMVDDASAGAIFEGLVRRRDAARDEISRFFLLPVERQA